MSVFITEDRSDKRDDAVAVDDVELSERNRQGLALIRRWRREPSNIDEKKWDEFERFLAENRLDLSRRGG